jgi:hypothetical protein
VISCPFVLSKAPPRLPRDPGSPEIYSTSDASRAPLKSFHGGAGFAGRCNEFAWRPRSSTPGGPGGPPTPAPRSCIIIGKQRKEACLLSPHPSTPPPPAQRESDRKNNNRKLRGYAFRITRPATTVRGRFMSRSRLQSRLRADASGERSQATSSQRNAKEFIQPCGVSISIGAFADETVCTHCSREVRNED